MKNKKVKKIVCKRRTAPESRDMQKIFPSKAAAKSYLICQQDKVMADANMKLSKLREAGVCTIQDVNKILVVRDLILVTLAENYQSAIISRHKKKAKKKKTTTKRKSPPSRRRKMTYAELRKAVIDHYGGPKCAQCSSTKAPFYLQHVHRQGGHLRLRVAGIGDSSRYDASKYYRYLIKVGFPHVHRQVVFCKTCFKSLTSHEGRDVLVRSCTVNRSPLYFFNPELLPIGDRSRWYQRFHDYGARCVTFWEDYLDSLYRQNKTH